MLRCSTILVINSDPKVSTLSSPPPILVKYIYQIRQNMMYSLEWGESQTEMGESKEVEPCSQSECDPFPYCCEMESQMNQYKTPPFYAL